VLFKRLWVGSEGGVIEPGARGTRIFVVPIVFLQKIAHSFAGKVPKTGFLDDLLQNAFIFISFTFHVYLFVLKVSDYALLPTTQMQQDGDLPVSKDPLSMRNSTSV